MNGNLSDMERLADAGPQVITAKLTPVGGTALHQACVHNRVDAARWLIERGAPIDARNRYRATPLHIGAFHGHLPVVRLLVEHGADISLRNRPGRTAEERARLRGHTAVADFLHRAAAGRSK